MVDKALPQLTATRLLVAACAVAGLVLGLAPAAHADDAAGTPAVEIRDVTPVEPAPAAAPRMRRATPARWYFELELGGGVYEDPEGILGLPLGRAGTPYDWGRNDFEGGGALRFNVGRHLRPCERVELRGSWQGWVEDSRQAGRFGFSQTPGGAVIVSPTSEATLENKVWLLSLELNWWKTIPAARNSRFAWGAGARVVSLTDKGIAKDWVGLAPDAYLEGEARNTLWAGQLMGAWHLRPNNRFEFAVIGKALAGAMNRKLTEKDTSIVTGGVTTDAERERTDFGWGLEGELRAMWRPWARVGITASYTILFLDEVSRGHEILDLSQAATGSVQIRDVKDSVVVHTLYFGVHFDV